MADVLAVVASLARRLSASYSSYSSTSSAYVDTTQKHQLPKPHEDHLVGTFGHLTNEALIGMVYHLDYLQFHQHQGQANLGQHPQLEKVMKELEVRGTAHEHRSWTLELEGVDMGYQRVERGRTGISSSLLRLADWFSRSMS